MLKLNILFLALCSLLGVSVGRIVQDGQCDPNIQLVEEFDLERFVGTWYEIQRSASPEQNADCSSFEITSSSNTINVHHSGVNKNFQEDSRGTATLASGSAKLTLDITMFDGHQRATSGDRMLKLGGEAKDFWVLSTDYVNFAVTYSCENISPTQRSIYLWVLGKARSYPNEMIPALITTTLNNLFGVALSNLATVDHSETACYVLPVIAPGESIILPGQCDNNIPVQQNFNVAAFLGTWYEISSYYTESSTGSCIKAQYSAGAAGVDVLNSQVINQELLTITGIATDASSDNSARLKVILNVSPDQNVEQDLWVLSTDYTNYAISYSCVNLNANNSRRIYSWILSRTRQMTDSVKESVDRVVDSIIELNQQYFLTTDQSDEGCFYFPEPSDEPVIFPGQCDLSIPVMQDFNPALYTGLWHNIELYPAPFQDGTCSNANYQLNGDVVDVVNTQVKSQTLDTIKATAVPLSNDGLGKLRVTFPVAGTNLTITTDYWILDTDYISYALVYSCSDLDDNRRQVSSWKLSRTKSLTNDANLAINRIISNINVLNQNYFKRVDQSETGCFYFPTPVPGVPVVFPGQCDTTIGMQNFVLSQFTGTWYEIQAYPKIEQTGQCINHVYSVASTSQLNLVSTSVNDQFLSATSATVTSSDSSGRLTITIPQASGQPVVIPFWIVNTDYNDYALAYACENRGTDFRAVWSWKLSRTKTLSTAAVTNINTAMANIDVLENRYYGPIDQSDEACFFLPVIAPGEPIVLPGQCDTTVKSVESFSTSLFAGRWRLIRSYQSDFQIGTCNVVRYTQIDSSSLTASHEQVVSQTLRKTAGTAAVISTDGSGTLRFTSPSSTEPFEYQILGTDYNSYALVYACQNQGTSQRRIWSWILSRGNTLSSTANDDINRIISGNQVLNDRYYYNEDRSNAGCFYFPEVDSSTTVKFRGECDESIPVVTNFRAADYLGLWHDIESYPTSFQGGTCNNALYTPLDGAVGVFNTQVINQKLDTITGTARVVSTDNSAKLNVTFNVGVNTKYWVLATDYTSYSLVYSCSRVDENDDEYVQVYSWKLSRTKTLSPTAIADMNAVISRIPVLNQMYYVSRDQTPAGCFYFPEPQTNEPVVFPGQCDTNINTVQDFNYQNFAGTWYEIEAYPKEEQSGQCINHVYSFVSTSRLDLVSSSISEQIRTLSNGVVTGSNGRLNIAIVSNGQPINIPFWIINTDYVDYALAYACVNRGSDYRAVWSWKLSRTKQLSTSAINAINLASANIDVLENRYYVPISQTDESCFYLPELSPGEPVIFPGQCDTNIRAVDNFNLARFARRWRLVQSYGTDSQVGTCNVARYTLRDALTLNVIHSQVVSQSLRSVSGTASVSSNDGTGRLQFSFSSSSEPSEYLVLGTDYDSYALVYACENIDSERRRVWSWKLSSDDTLSQTANDNINQIINRIDVLNERYYYNIDRTESGCFYFPEVDSTVNTKFPGQCNQNIPVVQNFNAASYMGLWHDIESYPMPFQFGTCPNAFYSIVGSTVNVFNTQVVNQKLDTINGVAEPSADGSGKLSVSFNVLGSLVTTNYWVLATDYSSYAYVYSCENLDDEYMSVFSWKLSRTKSLTPQAITEINRVMGTLNILDQRYYIQRDQSEAGCFYFPEPNPGNPVEFPGQCDNSIAAVPSFNPGQFAGTWHEIASYPYAETGQCVNHRFTLGTTSILALESFNVLNQTLYSSTSPVNLVSNDGSGRLTINVVVNGISTTIPFWVVDTDYSDYALAYGCANSGTDKRRIYSWKLSRTRQLSTAGSAAINAAMAKIDVVDDRYFETVQQTDAACFYLPPFSPNEPVTFPGQCDQNIPVIRNFRAGDYLGRWRLIQTYYAEFQMGTCSEALYSAGNDNNVIVYNTQVVNQQLDSITGSATVIATADDSGKLLVQFPTSDTPSEYWILDTDYDSYALVYTCENISTDRRRVWSWKLSRTNSLTATANNAINAIVDSINVLNDRYYQNVDRSDAACFYYPEPDVNTPVIFRGQCDLTIPALPNFRPAEYLGTWYDVASYPAPFQTGTCPKALYTANDDDSVRVENTQVVNQVLETWIGTARVTSDDESAKLDVTFNVNGVDVTTNYWVLNTDYTSYALVYSCENIDTERRSVFSWKLSRTPTLTPVANNAINAVINSIPVLDQRYYFQGDHGDEACFYYPDNKGGDVILPGQCLEDSEVPAITDFNVNLFAGTWHEVSRFPSAIQEGECAATQYTASGTNGFTVTQTIINNDKKRTVTAQATVSSDGRGVINAVIDGVPFNNVYILATDYNEYALAYSCRNINAKEKQIYSWKLSRSRSGLSAPANAAIDELVSNNIDLWEDYYRTTGQDDDACLYYPVFDQLPSSIVMPVPCPASIRGVPNFKPADYLGRWFETARYPVMAQRGECSRAEYSLGDRVIVYNTEVVDQTLRSQSGFADVSETGNGELSVQFVVDGVLRTTNYYVLATDYTSYSLVYSCSNVGDGTSLVSSWKLSRMPALTSEASATMDYVITNTRGITQEFYRNISQSDDDCFYIPDVNTEASPLFRGQCEEITGVEGFNAQRFAGWWHEIESYPSSEWWRGGECRSSEYTMDGTTFRVVDNWVEDNEGLVLPGTVTVTNDGRLRRLLSGSPHDSDTSYTIIEDVWVLATDYDTYALLYSCMNVDAEYRRVWSAKFSKTRSLSAAAQSYMASVIANNRVLYDQFYLSTDQSDATCFHYPKLTGDDVIIPGQCDSTISVVQDFNITEFAGNWYHLETYDKVGNSSCVGSRYTFDETAETIGVVNYEVRDEELQTVEGTARLVSTDGSARLEITLPVAGSEDATTTTTVSILATDYVNYALVYNCVNVNAFQRQVRAWKLSRERTLSSASNAVINILIQQRQELHQPFFKQIEHDDDCPEPSSALIIKSSIIMLLVCAMLQLVL